MRAPTLVLAPMQDVTDLPFMRVIQRYGGPDIYVTEYFRVHAEYKLEKRILRSITENQTGRPVYAQMIGQDIDALVRCAKELLTYPVAGIDLNIGCYHSHEEFYNLLEIFKSHAIDTLTIHGRTVLERYRTPVHTDCIRSAVEQLNCPVLANGNVVDVETGSGFLDRTGAAGLMIGRGAIRNPWIFDHLRSHFADETPTVPTHRDLLGYIMDLYQELANHQQLSAQDPFDERKHVNRMKKYMVYIAQGLDPEFEYHIRRCTREVEFKGVCEDFLNPNTPLPLCPPVESKLFCGFDALRSDT